MAESPLSILIKTVVSLGLIGGVGRMMYLNSNTKTDIVATNQNIQVLKQEYKKRSNRKIKKKVTVSQYQHATKVGNEVAQAMNQVLSDPKVKQQGLDYHSKAVKTIDKYDNYGNHRLAMTMPFAMTGYHVQFSHSGSDADDNILCGFMFYNQQNQLQMILKAKYSPDDGDFFAYHLVSTKQAYDANQQALGQLSANANKAANAKANAQKGGAGQ